MIKSKTVCVVPVITNKNQKENQLEKQPSKPKRRKRADETVWVASKLHSEFNSCKVKRIVTAPRLYYAIILFFSCLNT